MASGLSLPRQSWIYSSILLPVSTRDVTLGHGTKSKRRETPSRSSLLIGPHWIWRRSMAVRCKARWRVSSPPSDKTEISNVKAFSWPGSVFVKASRTIALLSANGVATQSQPHFRISVPKSLKPEVAPPKRQSAGPSTLSWSRALPLPSFVRS